MAHLGEHVESGSVSVVQNLDSHFLPIGFLGFIHLNTAMFSKLR